MAHRHAPPDSRTGPTGRIARALERFGSGRDARDARDAKELQTECVDVGATPVALVPDRTQATVAGTLRTVTLRPVGGVPALVVSATPRGVDFVVPRVIAGEEAVTVTVPDSSQVGQAALIISDLAEPIGFQFVAEPFEDVPSHEHAAVATAMRTAGPAILASAATVIAGLLCLSLADVNGTSGLALTGASIRDERVDGDETLRQLTKMWGR